MNKQRSIIILLLILLSNPAGANQIGTELAKLEVSFRSLSKVLTSQATQPPPASMSFGRYLTTLTMKNLGISDTDSPLIINKNKFNNTLGYYQVRVLDQSGVQCGWHGIKNVFWFLNALATTNPQKQITSLANLQKQGIYDPFYTLISQAVGGCPVSSMLSTDIIRVVIRYLCTGQSTSPLISTEPLDKLKSQNVLNYTAVCANLASSVVTFYKEGLDPASPIEEKITKIEKTVTNIMQRSTRLEGSSWLALTEKTYTQALEVLALFSYYEFYKPSKSENFKEFYHFKLSESASLGFIVLLPGRINHFVAIAAHKQGDILEYFLLNSINNGYLDKAYKNIESLSSLLNLSLDEFKKSLLRFFIEQYALDISDKQLQKIVPITMDIEDIEAGRIPTPTKNEMFDFTLDRVRDLLTAIKSYDLSNLELYDTIYKPWILKNLDTLKNKINTTNLPQNQKSKLIARTEQYINSIEEIEIIEEGEDIEML